MKILIADDHWVVRESLKQVVRRFGSEHQTFEAATLEQALSVLRREADMDLVLADLVMPGIAEFQGVRRLRAEFPLVPIVIISVHEDREHVLNAVACGVIGYIPKSASGEEIDRALERVLSGEVYFPRRLIEASPSDMPNEEPETSREPLVQGDLAALTGRERDVFDRLGKGYSVQKIASDLDLSSHTIRVHLGNITRKFDLSDRAALIHFAFKAAASDRKPAPVAAR